MPKSRNTWLMLPVVLTLLAGCAAPSVSPPLPYDVVAPPVVLPLPQSARQAQRSQSYSASVRSDIEAWASKLTGPVPPVSSASGPTTH